MNQYQRLIDNLTKLNLNNMAASIADYRQQVNDSQISFSEALLELTDKEKGDCLSATRKLKAKNKADPFSDCQTAQ